jgi:hypothetical protein
MESALTMFAHHHMPVILTITAVTAATVFAIISVKSSRRGKLPPGPTGLPIFGYIPFIPRNYTGKLRQLRQQYGKVFSLRLGSQDVVVVTDIDVIKTITNNDAFNNRPDFSMVEIFAPDILGNCK